MQECPVIISIDVKKGRIRLYKSMLGLLEKPDYVQILINIKKKEIAVLSVKKSLDAHRFRYSSRNCCELYSRSPVSSPENTNKFYLQETYCKAHSNFWNYNGSYEHPKIF